MITNLPKTEVLMDIAKEVKETQYGDVNLTITTFKGSPVGLTVSSYRHEKFSNDGNTESLKRVLGIFKEMVDSKKTGSLTFTVVFKEGQAKELINQLYDKKTYQIDNNATL